MISIFQIYAVGVFPKSNQTSSEKETNTLNDKRSENLKELEEFAGSKSRVVNAESGFEELDDNLMSKLSELLCTDHCKLS